MKHLDRLGNTFRIVIPPDEKGYIGRECPRKECAGYFKITLGTGLSDTEDCYCAYCGHKSHQQDFWTKAQIEYAKSVVFHKVTDALLKDLKALEFEHKPKGLLGIGFSLKVKGKPHPIRYYREERLETEVVCNQCGLRYAVYGVFAFCPDCGTHNSLQILRKNLELVEKQLALAEQVDDSDLAEHLVADALENIVSAFDAFGRETCGVHASRSPTAAGGAGISFQNLGRARDQVQQHFGYDLAAGVDQNEWVFACRCF